MPRIKPKRHGVLIDMTPLVDVAFLLLTFFMLTTTFKPSEEVTIDLPSSNSIIKLPASNVITLSLSKDGRIFMDVDSQKLRGKLFGAENANKAGVEVSKEKLGDYLMQARTSNPRLVTVIKGDKGSEFGIAQDVMDVLQKARITRFNLLTNLENN
ncbi:MAG: biopolymer transporter ExbD [bacterium]